MSNRGVLLAAAIALVSACGPSSKPKPQPPQPGSAAPDDTPLALDPTIRHGVLPNGLTYYVKPNKKPEKRAQLWRAVNAGSVPEPEAPRGLADRGARPPV